MKIKLITFGKLKNPAIIELWIHYKKLISKYFDLEMVELKDPGERKIKYSDIKDMLGECNIILTEKGNTLDSPKFSKYIEDCKLQTSSITFILGNAYGVDDDLFEHSKLKLALSSMTFPHELALIILLEQLFRAGSITAGSKYHK